MRTVHVRRVHYQILGSWTCPKYWWSLTHLATNFYWYCTACRRHLYCQYHFSTMVQYHYFPSMGEHLPKCWYLVFPYHVCASFDRSFTTPLHQSSTQNARQGRSRQMTHVAIDQRDCSLECITKERINQDSQLKIALRQLASPFVISSKALTHFISETSNIRLHSHPTRSHLTSRSTGTGNTAGVYSMRLLYIHNSLMIYTHAYQPVPSAYTLYYNKNYIIWANGTVIYWLCFNTMVRKDAWSISILLYRIKYFKWKP